MAANTNPVFSLTPNVTGVACGGTANIDATGIGTIGTDSFVCFTAGSNGSFIEKVRFCPGATVAATATTATTLRVFLTTILTATATTAANTHLLAEVAAAAQTAAHSTNATFYIDVPLGFAIPSGTRIIVTNHVVNAASTGWKAIGIGGDF